MYQEPLEEVPIERWQDLQSVFLSAHGSQWFIGSNVLETQTRLIKKGFNYGFRVYCLFGDVNNGYLALNVKAAFYEIIIQYPKYDTTILENVLRTTKLIDWGKEIILPFTAYHVIGAVKKIKEEKNIKIDLMPTLNTCILEKGSPLYEDVSLPPGFTFDFLRVADVELIDSKWPHRYPTSIWLFEFLINSKNGYGLYKDDKLISWILISEVGHLTHLYTLEEYRNCGYAELVVKLVSNELLKADRHVLLYSVHGNTNAMKLYHKIGFKECTDITVTWGFVNNSMKR